MTTDRERSGAAIEAPAAHRRCLLCGDLNPRSLRLSFTVADDGGVEARFVGRKDLQGYDDILHGGIVASLLDAAMTHCLFQRGVEAVTGDLHVRYVHPVPYRAAVDVRARVLADRPPLHRLEAQLLHEGRIMAWAEARFVQRPAARG